MLTSERLLLKLATNADLEFIHRLHSIPEVDEFNTLGIPNNIEDTRSIVLPWITENGKSEIIRFTFVIALASTKEKIGLFGLNLSSKKNRRGEVWYKLHPEHWNRGYATEALNTVLDFGFDKLKLHRIHAGSAVENVGSIKVLEKVGMIREGRGRKILPLSSGWSDNFEFAILETDSRK